MLGLRTPARREVARTLRVQAFSAALACVAALLAWLFFPALGEVPPHALIVTAVLAGAFALAESIVLHFEIGESAHSASLNEVPLVLGLFFLPPPLLVVARVGGAFLGLRFYRRQSLNKLVFNLGMMFLESVVAALVFRSLRGAAGSTEPVLVQSWAITVAACLVCSTVGSTAVLCVISLSTGKAEFADLRALLRTGTLSAVANATAAFVAVDALQHDRTALLPLLVLGSGLTLAYRSHVALRSRHDRLSSLYGFVRGVSTAGDGESVVRNVLTHAKELLKAEVASLTLAEATSQDRPLLLTYRLDTDGTFSSHRHPVTDRDWPVSRALSTGRSLLGQRGTRDPAVAHHLADLGVRDCVLVVVPGEEPAGALMVGSRRGEHSTFEPADVLALEGVAGHAAVALRNGRLLDRLTHESRHDMLTGLPNRAEFERRLTGHLERGSSVAVLFMDLDRFKDVNDTLGHSSGDKLLCEVAERLASVVELDAVVARLGGDEFGVLLAGHAPTSALQVAQQVRRALEQPVDVDGLSVDVGVSIGLAVAPDHGSSAGVLMRRADVAMYDAKARDGVALYDATRDDSSTSRLALVAQLRAALASDGFVLHYQPQVEAGTSTVQRFEALIRWPSSRGLVPPDEFMPVAERAGLLRGLTEWVLARALDDVVTWRTGAKGPGVAVNLSPRNLLEPGLADTVRRHLHERRLPPDCLTLEITEGSIIAEPERALDTLEKLRTIGVRLSVDDFGTGYSSLSYLRRLPVDEVKIDKSFVRNLATDDRDAAIVQAVVTLADSLSLTVVAEGVEDQASWDRLCELGADVVQGFHVGRPMPLDEARAWLALHRATQDATVRPLFDGLPRPRARA